MGGNVADGVTGRRGEGGRCTAKRCYRRSDHTTQSRPVAAKGRAGVYGDARYAIELRQRQADALLPDSTARRPTAAARGAGAQGRRPAPRTRGADRCGRCGGSSPAESHARRAGHAARLGAGRPPHGAPRCTRRVRRRRPPVTTPAARSETSIGQSRN